MKKMLLSSKNTLSPAPRHKKNSTVDTMWLLAEYKWKRATVPDALQRARWLKQRLIDLGPTYVKIGQFISTRPDVFDSNVVAEMQSMQDAVPSFHVRHVKDIIREELGVPVNEIFTEFENTPIASASISQVHRARLRSNGKMVVVKVQRPFIRDYFDSDFDSIARVINVLDMLTSGSANRQIKDTKTVIDECYNLLYQELSFTEEVKNMLTYQKSLKLLSEEYAEGGGGDDQQMALDVRIPRVYRSMCTDRVITMEYMPSNKINTSRDRRHSASLMLFFMQTIIKHGIIHGDPHPGNIGYVPGTDVVVMYDLGQMVKLDPVFMRGVKPLMFSIYDRDVDHICKLLVESRTLIPTSPKFEQRQLYPFITQLIQYFENVDFAEFKVSLMQSAVLNNSDLENFRINPQLIMLMRSLALLEGTCKNIDPSFSYFDIIASLRNEFMMEALDHKGRKVFNDMFLSSSGDDDDDVNGVVTNVQTSITTKDNNSLVLAPTPLVVGMLAMQAFVAAMEIFPNL